MPPLGRILETALYFDDLARAATFYESVFGLPSLLATPALRAYDVAGASVLLLFTRGGSLRTQTMPGGTIPPHDGAGPVHMAFAIAADTLNDWERHLAAHGVEIEGRTVWQRGGVSLYVRDPDGHLLEVATPGLWRTDTTSAGSRPRSACLAGTRWLQARHLPQACTRTPRPWRSNAPSPSSSRTRRAAT